MIGLSPLSAGHRRRFQPTCVRPSTGSYPRFSLPTDSSPGFASAARDSSRPVKARFRSGSLSVNLAPRQRLAGSFYKRHAVTPQGCSDCSWAHGFRYCFTPLPGCFSPFPHGTGSLSLTRLYLALADGPACFRQDSSCLAVLRIPLGFNWISNTGLAPSSAGLSIPFFYPLSCHIMVLQPRSLDRFGLLPFRSPLLRESLLFSFPPAT